MDQLDLSVIILSYNTKEITHRCLQKLEEAKIYCEKKLNNKIEVIALDNGSSDGSAQMIKTDHPQVKLIESKENLGFSKGNNLAMKQCNNPFILLLNSDVYVEEDSLYKTLAYFKVNKNCDVMGAKLKYASGKLQPSAGNLPNPLNIITWILGLGFLPLINNFIPPLHARNMPFFSKAHQVGWIMGAFFMIKKAIFEKTLGFDENLFMHMEEVEWCKRINMAHFKIWYVPQVEVVHLHGASSKFDLGASFLNELKGIKYYLKKHYPPFYLPVKLFLILGLILRIIAFSLLGKTKRARIYVEGLGVI
ncbi:glycosyltransferase family 2 protein [Candidatus Microgenomates bacterium]|nr:glycosyltransferase family 2 protein [Candidatus Microgenomates bacterium]